MIFTDDREIDFFTKGRRPKLKKKISRSEVYNHSMTEYEVVFIHNSDFTPLPPPNFEA